MKTVEITYKCDFCEKITHREFIAPFNPKESTYYSNCQAEVIIGQFDDEFNSTCDKHVCTKCYSKFFEPTKP